MKWFAVPILAYQRSFLRDLFIILFLFFFQACVGDNRPVVKIGVSVPNTNTTTYNLIRKAIFDQLVELNLTPQSDHIEIIWNSVQDQANGKNAIAMELQQVKAMLNQGIKVLVLNSIDSRSAYSILREAKRKSVPVLTLDEPIRNDQIVGHFSIDQSRLGEIAAAYEREGSDVFVCDISEPFIKSFKNDFPNIFINKLFNSSTQLGLNPLIIKYLIYYYHFH